FHSFGHLFPSASLTSATRPSGRLKRPVFPFILIGALHWEALSRRQQTGPLTKDSLAFLASLTSRQPATYATPTIAPAILSNCSTGGSCGSPSPPPSFLLISDSSPLLSPAWMSKGPR